MITEKNELLLEKVYSKRVLLPQQDLMILLKEIKTYCESNLVIIESLTTVTFGMKKNEKGENVLDEEIILKPEKEDEKMPEGFVFKEKLYITNALKAHFEGNEEQATQVFIEMNKYITENKLQPITPGYSVSYKPYCRTDHTMNVDLFVGLNPNVL